MRVPGGFLAVVWLLGEVASAVPNPTLVARTAADPTAAWVTVDKSGLPKTVTPTVSTVSGTRTIVSGAPHDLTATVFTRTRMGEIKTSTGNPPMPTAKGRNGAGVFAVCSNSDGDDAPFCTPEANITVNLKKTYYITWDPTFFNVSKMRDTVTVAGHYFNYTTGNVTDDKIFSHEVSASLGFYPWYIDKKILSERSVKAANVSLSISAVHSKTKKAKTFRGPKVLVAKKVKAAARPRKRPDDTALYVALPTVAGFVLFVLVGTCLWNRKVRRIGIGNVMSRARHGMAKGRRHGARFRLPGRGRREQKYQAIPLMDDDDDDDDADDYDVDAAADRRRRTGYRRGYD